MIVAFTTARAPRPSTRSSANSVVVSSGVELSGPKAVFGTPLLAALAADVAAGVADAVVAAEHELVIVSVSSVTAPFRASARPSMVAPVVTVIEVRAMIVPLKACLGAASRGRGSPVPSKFGLEGGPVDGRWQAW